MPPPAHDSARAPSWLLPLLMILFFGSGVCALVYQVMWPAARRIFIAGPDEVGEFVGDGPVLTDDKPMIEYFLSLPSHDAPGGYKGKRAPIETILVP